jgi:hypothetical protein
MKPEVKKWWGSPQNFELILTLAYAFHSQIKNLLREAGHPLVLVEKKHINSEVAGEELQLLLLGLSPVPEVDYFVASVLLANADSSQSSGIHLIQREEGVIPFLIGYHNELGLNFTPSLLIEVLDSIDREETRHYHLDSYLRPTDNDNPIMPKRSQEEKDLDNVCLFHVGTFLARHLSDTKEDFLIIQDTQSRIPGLKWFVSAVTSYVDIGTPEEKDSGNYTVWRDYIQAIIIHEASYGSINPNSMIVIPHPLSVPTNLASPPGTLHMEGVNLWTQDPHRLLPFLVQAVAEKFHMDPADFGM